MSDQMITEAEIEAALDAWYAGDAWRTAWPTAEVVKCKSRMRAALLAAARVRGKIAKPIDWGQIGLDTNVAINQAFEDAARCGVGFVQITPDKSACIPPERVFVFGSETLPGAGCSVETLMTALDHRRDRPPQPFTVFARAEKAEAELAAAFDFLTKITAERDAARAQADALAVALRESRPHFRRLVDCPNCRTVFGIEAARPAPAPDVRLDKVADKIVDEWLRNTFHQGTKPLRSTILSALTAAEARGAERALEAAMKGGKP